MCFKPQNTAESKLINEEKVILVISEYSLQENFVKCASVMYFEKQYLKTNKYEVFMYKLVQSK